MAGWAPKPPRRVTHAQRFGQGSSDDPSHEDADAEASEPPVQPPAQPPVQPPEPAAPIPVPSTSKGNRTEQQKRAAMMARMREQHETAAKRFGGEDKMMQKIREDAAKELDSRNPVTREHHERIQRSWELGLSLIAPHVKEEDFWLDKTVRDYAADFIRHKATTSPGRDKLYCHAGTVGGWISHFIYCIEHFTRDSNGRPCGSKLLRSGLWQNLHDTYIDLIKEYDLGRHTLVKTISYGKEEFQLVAEYALEGTRGRAVKLQAMAALIMIFGSGYMRLGDIRPYRVSRGCWDVHVDFKHHKGWNNSTRGLVSTHVYKALKNVENLLFGPFWFVAYLQYRKAFKFNTLKELIESEDFIKAIACGTGLTNPPEPARSSNVSETVARVIKGAGLKEGNCVAFRRGNANDNDILLGSHKASLILGHSNAHSVLSMHYSMSTANIDLLGIRTGESTAQYQPGVEESLILNCRTKAAVVLISSRKAIARIDGIDEKKQKGKAKEELEELVKTAKDDAIDNSAEVATIQARIHSNWAEFIQLLGVGSKGYNHVAKMKHKQQTISTIKRRKDFKKMLADPKKAAKAKALEKALRDDFDLLAAEKKALSRAATRGVAKELKKKPKVADTSAERDAALEHFKQPSNLLDLPSESSSKNLKQAAPAWLAPIYKPVQELSREERENEIAQLNAADEATPADLAAKLSLEVLNMPQKSFAGANQQNIESLTRVLVSISGETPKPSQVDALDSQVFIGGQPLEPYDDADETSCIKDLSMPDARCALLHIDLAPLTAKEDLKRQIEADGGLILCQLCKENPDAEERTWATVFKLDRHMYTHTEWKDLSLRMKKVSDKVMCPAITCQKLLSNEQTARRHCLSSACPEQEGFKLMKKLHNASYRAYRRKYKGIDSKDEEKDEDEDECEDDDEVDDEDEGDWDEEDPDEWAEEEDEEEEEEAWDDEPEDEDHAARKHVTEEDLDKAETLAGRDVKTIMETGEDYGFNPEKLKVLAPLMVIIGNNMGNIVLDA